MRPKKLKAESAKGQRVESGQLSEAELQQVSGGTAADTGEAMIDMEIENAKESVEQTQNFAKDVKQKLGAIRRGNRR